MSSDTSLLEDLAQQVATNAKSVSKFIEACGYAQPSFDRDAPISVLPESAPENIQIAQQNLTDAALKLYQLSLGPREYLPNLQASYHYNACLRWLCHFKIFSYVPIYGSISYDTLASRAQVPESQLKSITRMAMTNNLFSELSPNTISHSATSALLVTDPSFHDWAVVMCELSAPTAAKYVEATTKWPNSVAKNETAYNIAFDTDLPFFDHLALDPEKTKQFAGYMKNVTSSQGTSMEHLLRGFPWASLGEATVVDVGGSTGNASISLAKVFPNLSFIVQDLSVNAADGEASLVAQHPDLTTRIIFQSHDIFTPQLVKGANVYLLRMILHDWPDAESIKILSQIVPCLTAGARIIIMDSVLPSPGVIPATKERLFRVRDLTMRQVFNSRERELEDWYSLLERADKRLRIKNIQQPFGSVMSIIEVVFNDEAYLGSGAVN